MDSGVHLFIVTGDKGGGDGFEYGGSQRLFALGGVLDRGPDAAGVRGTLTLFP